MPFTFCGFLALSVEVLPLSDLWLGNGLGGVNCPRVVLHNGHGVVLKRFYEGLGSGSVVLEWSWRAVLLGVLGRLGEFCLRRAWNM